MRIVKFIVLTAIGLLATNIASFAQCAMCKATLETNVSNGAETVLAAQLNFGILYLFAAPYLVIASVGFFWYRNSRYSKNPTWFLGIIFVRRNGVLILVGTTFLKWLKSHCFIFL